MSQLLSVKSRVNVWATKINKLSGQKVVNVGNTALDRSRASRYMNILDSLMHCSALTFCKYAAELGNFQEEQASYTAELIEELEGRRVLLEPTSATFHLINYGLLDLERTFSLNRVSLCIEELNKYSKCMEQREFKNLTVLFHNLRSVMNMDLIRLEPARADLSIVITLMPSFTIALFRRGTVNMSLGKYHEATNDFSRVKELDPKNPSVYLMQALVLFKQNRFEETIEELTHCISTRDAQAFYLRSRCYLALGKTVKCFADARRAYELKSSADYISDHFITVKKLISEGAVD